MFGFIPSVITLIVSSLDPRKLLPTMLTLGVVEELIEEYREREQFEQAISHELAPVEVDPFLVEQALVKQVDKLKAQGIEIPPLMQKNYNRIKQRWEGKECQEE